MQLLQILQFQSITENNEIISEVQDCRNIYKFFSLNGGLELLLTQKSTFLNQVIIQMVICLNGKPINIKYKAQQLLVVRVLNKINLSCRGSIYFLMCNSNLILRNTNFISKRVDFTDESRQKQIEAMVELFTKEYWRISNLIQQINQSSYCIPTDNKNKINYAFELLLYHYTLLTRKFELYQWKNNQIQIDNPKFHQRVARQAPLESFYHSSGGFKIKYLSESFIRKQQSTSVKFLEQSPARPTAANDNNITYGLIQFDYSNKIVWQMFQIRQFCTLSTGNATYYFPYTNDGKENTQINKSKIHKKLVKKKPHDDDKSKKKVENEHKILKLYNKESNNHVSKFMKLRNQNQGLFTQFCNYKDLNHMKNLFSTTLSLYSKIYLLYQLVMGLRFIHDKEVIHMDIKSTNLLVMRGLVLKITDFGQSIHQKEKIDFNNLCYTPPYAPPQIFIPKASLTQKVDVYSVGTVMIETLFDQKPLVMTAAKLDLYEQLMKEDYSSNIHLRRLFDNLQCYGNRCVLEILYKTAWHCMRPQPQSRPHLDRIAIILRLCISYLDRLI